MAPDRGKKRPNPAPKIIARARRSSASEWLSRLSSLRFFSPPAWPRCSSWRKTSRRSPLRMSSSSRRAPLQPIFWRLVLQPSWQRLLEHSSWRTFLPRTSSPSPCCSISCRLSAPGFYLPPPAPLSSRHRQCPTRRVFFPSQRDCPSRCQRPHRQLHRLVRQEHFRVLLLRPRRRSVWKLANLCSWNRRNFSFSCPAKLQVLRSV